jgi:D-alanine-D-alanine ligase-like ATP-grasp enzyme
MKQSFVSPILKKLARRAGLKVVVEPTYGYVGQVVLPSGAKRYFRNTCFDLNPLGASEVAKDKAYASYFMKLMGFPVPEGDVFFSPHWREVLNSRRGFEAAYRYACRLGFPVIVKPNSKSQGFGVCKVWTKQEFMRAVRFICEREHVFLVQRPVSGRDYRIVVLDDTVISAYERIPLSVVGDGRSSIVQLLKIKQRQFRRNGRDTTLKLNDYRIALRLKRQRLSQRTIPARGQTIKLLDAANLSTGGEAMDVTNSMSPYFRNLAVRITSDMGLRYSGVDLILDGDICDASSKFVVLEINAAPGIDHYASVGKSQQRIVERMYLRVLNAMKGVKTS